MYGKLPPAVDIHKRISSASSPNAFAGMETHMTKLIVTGAKGRMGNLVCELAQQSHRLQLVAPLDLEDSLEAVIHKGDVIIDFTEPTATLSFLHTAVHYKKPMVIGTTGHDQKNREMIEEAARTIPIVFSPNMSIGVNLLFALVTKTARTLGKEYPLQIF